MYVCLRARLFLRLYHAAMYLKTCIHGVYIHGMIACLRTRTSTYKHVHEGDAVGSGAKGSVSILDEDALEFLLIFGEVFSVSVQKLFL